MKGSSRLASPSAWGARAVAALALCVGPALGAQTTQVAKGPEPGATELLVVPAFSSQDKKLGCDAANEVRDRLDGDANTKQLYVIPGHNIEETLKASGFPVCQPISSTDDKQLTQQLRGDAYLDGTASKTPTGIRLDAKLVLARDASAAQPLPPAEGAKLGDVAKQVSHDVQAAIKQLSGERACFDSARAGKYPSAIAAAQKAIAAYPQAALARLCIANTLVAMKAPPDSIIQVANQILANDPHNHRALELASQAYYDRKDYDNAVKDWSQLIASDPSNTVLVEDVVTKIVQSGHADAALPIVAQAVKDNPEDPKLKAIQYRLLFLTKHYKDAAAAGEEAVKADTAFADTLFFQRQTISYLADSQPQKAAETAAKGLAKFASNGTLQQLQVQAFLAAGQTQQAVEALRKILAANPKAPAAWEQLYAADVSLNQPDSALAALHGAVANGDSANKVAPFALSQANTYFKKGQASKNADTLGLAIRFAKYADSLAANPAAKFIAGASEFQIGAAAEQAAAKTKDCPGVKVADANWSAANIDLHGGGSTAPAAAAQMLQYVTQYLPSIEKQVKLWCK